MKDLECSIKADDSGKSMGWSIQGGLPTEYSSDFMQRNRGEIHCVFCDNLLPNLIKNLDALRLSEPASPPKSRGRFNHEQLIEQFKEMRVDGRKPLFSTLVDCAKGFLTAEDRDQMANLIRPDPAPLPQVTSTKCYACDDYHWRHASECSASDSSHDYSCITNHDNYSSSGHHYHHLCYDDHTSCGHDNSNHSSDPSCTY